MLETSWDPIFLLPRGWGFYLPLVLLAGRVHRRGAVAACLYCVRGDLVCPAQSGAPHKKTMAPWGIWVA